MGTDPCETCGDPTPWQGRKLCDPCWEVEHRLGDYLRRGRQKALDVLQLALDERAADIRLVQAVRHAEPRDEAEHAAALWLRMATLWDASEEDALHDKLGELMAEWHAGAGDRGEIVKAAGLWERLVTVWESDDGEGGTEADDGILTTIGELVAEWQGFADKKAEPT